LGARGIINGKMWEIIGYMERVNPAYDFIWSEYLLFNPKDGFSWLIEANNHWNFTKTIKARIHDENITSLYENKTYKLYMKGRAKTYFVLGEFYWRVSAGEVVSL
jgi:hypothetical protein